MFTVTLTGTRDEDVEVAYTTADGTATAPDDYAGTPGTLTFTLTVDVQTILVSTVDDTIEEANETFTVTLTSSDATVQDGSATGTINDDDEPPPTLPTLTIEDAAANEGEDVVFTVTLTGTRDEDVEVAYTTADGTATAPDDYAGTPGTLTFTPTVDVQTISVSTVDDTIEEANETFTVTLTSSDATVQDGSATGTINDDDEPPPTLPTLTIEDAAANEGEDVVFTVTLTGTRDEDVEVAYTTADGTATAPDDYAGTPGTLTFTPTVDVQTISVSTVDDTIEEANETFTVTLTSSDATVQDGSATGTINDDDETVTTLPTLSITDDTVEEGEEAEFTVTLTGPRTGSVSVAFATADGTADAGDDYTSNSGTLTFGTGESSKTIQVPTIDDSDEEQTETFSVSLSSPGRELQDHPGAHHRRQRAEQPSRTATPPAPSPTTTGPSPHCPC